MVLGVRVDLEGAWTEWLMNPLTFTSCIGLLVRYIMGELLIAPLCPLSSVMCLVVSYVTSVLRQEGGADMCSVA